MREGINWEKKKDKKEVTNNGLINKEKKKRW